MIDVVYIDDEKALLHSMSLVLEAAGLSVRTFGSPNEAVEFIAENEVGLVLCDLRMPGMSGMEVLAAIDKELPFFLVSGDLSLEDELASNPRVRGMIAKPMRPFELAEKLKKLLGRED